MKEERFKDQYGSLEAQEVEAIKKLMEVALRNSISKEDAINKIKEALPKNRNFFGPLVSYYEGDKARNFNAMVQTLDDQNQSVDIEAFYSGY